MIITIKCQECQVLFKFDSPNLSMSQKKYCPDCLLKHKNECLSHYKNTKKIGRPTNKIKVYGKDDCKMGWDDCNYGGY